MNVQTALISIQRLEKRKSKLTALQPDKAIESGLKIERTAKDGNTGNVMFAYVDRVQYITYLKHKFNLHRKRESLRNVLRNSV